MRIDHLPFILVLLLTDVDLLVRNLTTDLGHILLHFV